MHCLSNLDEPIKKEIARIQLVIIISFQMESSEFKELRFEFLLQLEVLTIALKIEQLGDHNLLLAIC